jgi:hypothetical protein
MKNITIIATLLLQPLFAFAVPHSSFQEQITKAQQQCPSLNCPGLSVTVRKIEQSQLELKAALQSVADELAQALWPDTILEGPYKVEKIQVNLEKVEAVVSDDVIIGYRITYSNNAVYVDEEASGTIRESGFVSADFSDYFRDEEFIADFFRD